MDAFGISLQAFMISSFSSDLLKLQPFSSLLRKEEGIRSISGQILVEKETREVSKGFHEFSLTLDSSKEAKTQENS